MKFIVFISLIAYILINFVKIPINLPTFVNVNGVEYYNGLIFFAIKRFAAYPTPQMHRNIGCFWEPGLFATLNTIALIFEVLYKNKISFYNVIIMFLAMITTKSTFGYIMIAFVIVVYLSRNINSSKGSIGFIILLISVILLLINLNNILEILYSKWPIVFSKIADKTSSSVRLEAPITNLKVFLKNPLFGAGFGKADNLFYSFNKIAQTSTSTYFLAAFGLFGISHSLFFIYGIMMQKKLNILNRLTLLMIFFIILNKEPHIFNTAIFIIMFYFLKIPTIKYEG
ncbi:O-antigen ligase family protein [Bacteroidota bacterium]